MRCFLPLLFCSTALFAADIPVAPGQSIQTAIQAAAPGDRVLVDAGTYVETLDFLGKSIEVIGLAGPELTILDGGGAAPVVRFANNEGPATRLAGFTVRNGHASFGTGGVAVATGATPTLSDCVVRNNSGKFGGGISGNPILERCAVVQNSASLSHGGGIYGAPQMTHCVVANNSTTGRGGGLYVVGDAPVRVRDCFFVGNRSILGDGGRGGGVYVATTADVRFERCVIAGNLSAGGVFGSYGGGVQATSANTLLDHCDLLDNTLASTATTGGAVYGPAVLNDCIVRGNSGTQLVNVSAVSFSDVEGGYSGAGNFDADPLFVDAATGDRHLLAASPCRGVASDGGDVGALGYASLYATPPDAAANALPNAPQVSVALDGDVVDFTLLGDPADAGRTYVLLASLSGSAPGTPFGFVQLPLNVDAFTVRALGWLNKPVLPGSMGQLDADGRATAGLNSITSFDPSFAGLELSFAWVLNNPVDVVSTPLTVALVP